MFLACYASFLLGPGFFIHDLYCCLLQEGEAVGSTVLQLVVMDRDMPRNGPPFSFHIVSGNEDRRFHVDQGGLLSLAAPLRKKTKAHHQLKIQVTEKCVIGWMTSPCLHDMMSHVSDHLYLLNESQGIFPRVEIAWDFDLIPLGHKCLWTSTGGILPSYKVMI